MLTVFFLGSECDPDWLGVDISAPFLVQELLYIMVDKIIINLFANAKHCMMQHQAFTLM